MQPEGENTLRGPDGILIFLVEFVYLDSERFLQMRLRRRALDTTETELKAIAAAANIGFNKMPKKG